MKQIRSVRAHAIVLRHIDWGEADRLVTLFTREQGKLRAVVRGARKITSRKAGHLEPFIHVKLQLARGKNMFVVAQADTIDAFIPLRETLEMTGTASYVVELLDRFVYEDEGPNPTLYRLLVETLKRLSTGEDNWLSVRYYEMRLLDFLGFRPQLFECANCGREIKAENQFFSYAMGGVICPQCGQGLPNLTGISMQVLKYLRHFQRSSFDEAKKARPTSDVQYEVETLMQDYFTYLLERELNTPGFLKNVRRIKK